MLAKTFVQCCGLSSYIRACIYFTVHVAAALQPAAAMMAVVPVVISSVVTTLTASHEVICPRYQIINVGIANASNLGNVTVQVCQVLVQRINLAFMRSCLSALFTLAQCMKLMLVATHELSMHSISDAY